MREVSPFRSTAWVALALVAATLSACTAHRVPTKAQDEEVVLSLRNVGEKTLRCTILFGHWVEQGVGSIAPGAPLSIELWRQASDGALYVPRYDGRRMMIENLICGPLTDWWTRRADVSLLPLRGGAARRYTASCAVSAQTICGQPVAE